eukprot:326510-Prymnesium_polylepis.1
MASRWLETGYAGPPLLRLRPRPTCGSGAADRPTLAGKPCLCGLRGRIPFATCLSETKRSERGVSRSRPTMRG